MLAQGIAPGKQLLFCLRADHSDARPLYLVFHIVETALLEFERTNVINIRIVASNIPGKRPVFIGHSGLLVDAWSDMRDLRKIRRQRVDVVLRELYIDACLLSASLCGSRARHHDDEFRTEVGEDVGAGSTEPVAIR